MAAPERFVPRRLGPLTADLSERPWPEPDDAERFRAFSRMASALFHLEFREREQTMLDAWERAGDDPAAAEGVTRELTGLLDGANYTTLTMDDLADAFERETLIPLRLDVDLEDYDEVLVYRRGTRRETIEIPTWRGLRSKERTITVDERVVVHTRVKPASWFAEREIDPASRNLIPGDISIKQFQNVPRADIEMLLPSTRVRFRMIDTVVVGVPALISGIAVLATKLLPTLGLMALVIGAWLGLRDERPNLDQTAVVVLFGGVLTLGGFLVRQWSKLKNRRVRYLKTLSENLYLRTLAAGPGVLHVLLAGAEEQEVAEVLLGYRFLLEAPDGMRPADLDVAVESWLRETCQREVDFELDDALGKLRRLGVVTGSRTVRPRPLPEALALLDRRWEDLFMSERPVPTASATARALVRLRSVVDRFQGRLGDRRTARVGNALRAPAGNSASTPVVQGS